MVKRTAHTFVSYHSLTKWLRKILISDVMMVVRYMTNVFDGVKLRKIHNEVTILAKMTHVAKFMGPAWGPPGSCRPQMGPMLAPWTLLSGYALFLE